MSDDYINPSTATHVRIHPDGKGNWMIDAADLQGRYTEACWDSYFLQTPDGKRHWEYIPSIAAARDLVPAFIKEVVPHLRGHEPVIINDADRYNLEPQPATQRPWENDDPLAPIIRDLKEAVVELRSNILDVRGSDRMHHISELLRNSERLIKWYDQEYGAIHIEVELPDGTITAYQLDGETWTKVREILEESRPKGSQA